MMEVKVYLPSTSFYSTPIILSFPQDTPAKEVVQELSSKFHVQEGDERSLVITPTSSTTGGVVDPRTAVKSFNLDIEERLELWRAPYLINILLVSDYTSPDPVKQRKEIVFDYGSPLNYEEFIFQYTPTLEEEDKVRWLDSKSSLADQSFEGTSWLMCYPVNITLKTKEAQLKFIDTIKEGYLVKQTQKGNKKTPKRKRWVVIKDHFLFYFKNKGDSLPAGAIPLEYYAVSIVQIKQQPSLHLKRAIGRFEDSQADLYIMYGEEGDDLLKWKEALQRNCFGFEGVFGVTLNEISNRPSLKPFIPDVVLKLSNYLTEKALDEEGILRISGSNAIVQFYKDQFDRGMEVDLSAFQDVHVAASLLKLYFRELPDPAIPFMFYDDIMSVMNAQGIDKSIDVLPILLEIIAKLPESHFHLLKYMCGFLYEVSQHSSTNLMGLPNLGTVMGPNLLRPPDHKVGSFVQDSPLISECIQLLIKNHDQIKKSEHSFRNQPRPAPLRSEEEAKADGLISPRMEIPPTNAAQPPSDIKAQRPKRPAKISNKGKDGKLDIIKGGLFLEPIPKQVQTQLATPPKSPPPSPPMVMDSVIAAQQNVTHELQQHLLTNPPAHNPSLLFTPPNCTRAANVTDASTPVPHQRALPVPSQQSPPVPPRHSVKVSPKVPARNPSPSKITEAEPKKAEIPKSDPPKVEHSKPDTSKPGSLKVEPSKTSLKSSPSKDLTNFIKEKREPPLDAPTTTAVPTAVPLVDKNDAQPAKDATREEEKSGADKNKPMPRKLELTTTATRIIPPTFPRPIKLKKEAPHPPLRPAAVVISRGLDAGENRVAILEEECKDLRKKVEEEEFKRKLLELKMELLVQRMNDMERKLAPQN